MEPNQQQEWINLFLRKELKGKELESFQNEMKRNSSFAIEVKKQEQLARAVILKGNLELKNQFQDIYNDLKSPNHSPNTFSKQRRRIIRIGLTAAAAVIGILLLTFFWNKPSQEQQLFTEYYQPYNASFTDRSTDNQEQIAEAESAYRAEDFESAITLLEKLIQQDSKDYRLQLALGNAYIQSDQLEKAENTFNQILSKGTSLFADQTTWYLALTHLKKGEIELSKKWLESLTQNEGQVYYEDSKSLLEKITEEK